MFFSSKHAITFWTNLNPNIESEWEQFYSVCDGLLTAYIRVRWHWFVTRKPGAKWLSTSRDPLSFDPSDLLAALNEGENARSHEGITVLSSVVKMFAEYGLALSLRLSWVDVSHRTRRLKHFFSLRSSEFVLCKQTCLFYCIIYLLVKDFELLGIKKG